MPKTRHTNIPAAYLCPMRDGKILLSGRHNTGYHDGEYSLIAGHLEQGESFKAAIIREAKEEAGITISEADLNLAHFLHRKSDDGEERVDIFFFVEKWTGEITNAEPHKCSGLEWFDLKRLPENMVPYVRIVLQKILEQTIYYEDGWTI